MHWTCPLNSKLIKQIKNTVKENFSVLKNWNDEKNSLRVRSNQYTLTSLKTTPQSNRHPKGQCAETERQPMVNKQSENASLKLATTWRKRLRRMNRHTGREFQSLGQATKTSKFTTNSLIMTSKRNSDDVLEYWQVKELSTEYKYCVSV